MASNKRSLSSLTIPSSQPTDSSTSSASSPISGVPVSFFSSASSAAPTQGIALLSRRQHVDAHTARRLLRRIAQDELAILLNGTNTTHCDKKQKTSMVVGAADNDNNNDDSAAAAVLQSSYEAALFHEDVRKTALQLIREQAARDALRAIEEASALSVSPSTTTTTTKDPLTIIETGTKALREYGVNVTVESSSSSPAATTSPLLTLHDNMYRGRPLKGATSAALYIAAEAEVGFPPKRRDQWRYPGGQTSGSGGGSGGSSSSSSSSLHMREAKETLKRPAFPDRAYLHGQSGGGAEGMRAVALASHFDDAAVTETSLRNMHTKALVSMK